MTPRQRLLAVPGFIVVSVLCQKAFFESRYDVAGHAAEHLQSATAPFAAAAVVATLLWLTPPARRSLSALVALVAWLACTVLVLIGNVRVVDALVDAGMGRTPTSQLTERDAVDSAHSLANSAPWFGVLAGLLVLAALWRLGVLTRRGAIVAGFLNVLIPPWILPGAAPVVVAVQRAWATWQTSTTPARG